ncbi:MAG: hypothetical protein ABIH11_02230 [Candidatus Altiarchaeota archaeon]
MRSEALIVILVLFCLGCIEARQSLSLKLLQYPEERRFELRNTGQVEYTGCRIIVNENWTYDAVAIPEGERISMDPDRFKSESGDDLNLSTVLDSIEIYCAEGYYGGKIQSTPQ